jgi:AAA family ATP:ADP antiporter
METPAAARIPRVQLACMGALAFLVLAGYEAARPAVDALFVGVYTEEGLPYVWLAVGVAALLTVGVYNRFATRIGLIRLFQNSTLISIVMLLPLMAADRFNIPGAVFALYVWKDVYIVVLVETFWSYANSTFPTEKAKWYYGFFCMIGSLGSICGAQAVRWIAIAFGTSYGLWLVLILLSAVWMVCLLLGRIVEDTVKAPPKEKSSFGEGVTVIRNSRYLLYLLLLIAVTQVTITLIDYQYNAALLSEYPEKDARTAAGANVYTAISIASLILQASTCFILAYAGIYRTLLAIPLLLGVAICQFAIMPLFLTVAVAKVASKCMDYSIFRAAKELLYIPLSYAERTQGKAVVDILTYRLTKAAVSLLLLTLAAVKAVGWVTVINLGLLVVWGWLVARIVQRYREDQRSAD